MAKICDLASEPRAICSQKQQPSFFYRTINILSRIAVFHVNEAEMQGNLNESMICNEGTFAAMLRADRS